MVNMTSKINIKYDKIVIIDPGKNSVKVLVFSPSYQLLTSFDFPSKTLKKMNFADIDGSSEKQYKIELHNEKYVVGDGIISSYNFATTKNNKHHLLCVYTAIANVVDVAKENIHLIVGYPSSDFINTDQRKTYEKMLKPDDEPVSLMLNGVEKTFNIVDVAVYPEGIAMRPRIKNVNRIVHIVDIGGQNLNYRMYDAKGNTLKSFSLDEAGINHLEESIKRNLRGFVQADKVSVESIDTIKAIKDRKIVEVDDSLLSSYTSTKDFMTDCVLDFIDKNILGQLISKGVNLYQRGYLIIFTGGGSMLLKSYLNEVLTNNTGNMYFSDTARWDNCISYTIKDLGDRCKKLDLTKEAQLIGKNILAQTEQLVQNDIETV